MTAILSLPVSTTSVTSNPDQRRRVRTAFAFLAPSLIGVLLLKTAQTDANYILKTS
jgi:hypothetical protein